MTIIPMCIHCSFCSTVRGTHFDPTVHEGHHTVRAVCSDDVRLRQHCRISSGCVVSLRGKVFTAFFETHLGMVGWVMVKFFVSLSVSLSASAIFNFSFSVCLYMFLPWPPRIRISAAVMMKLKTNCIAYVPWC